ncbi:unnamed protein product [Thelazia callipaeda]|uniref:Carn_acyltransf domain-containing protein n=1 Tax=Thelazia callipaeda TaxID=103827 RepID=A0A0N5D516_THECL|nr:unnamed protein product [Thelazia callipaeda]
MKLRSEIVEIAIRNYSKRNLSHDDYQYIHRSDLPTYHFQKSLRRLPIPKLPLTCHRLLRAAEAVLQAEELHSLKKLAANFLACEGPALQRELILHDRRNQHRSYISEPWFDTYLCNRLPCPVNSNPFITYPPDPDPAYNAQLIRATNLIASFGRFKRALDAECLKPEIFYMNPKTEASASFKWVCKHLPQNLRWYGAAVFGAFPLDMSQYRSLFGCSRIPQKGKDWLFHCKDSRHFIVLHDGRIYAIDLFDRGGMIAYIMFIVLK